ncbi:MAG: hypothetical protein WC178_00645 [Candidatus Paceibacterota bacterium]
MLPTVKPTKFTYELKEILNSFSKDVNLKVGNEGFERLYKENIFNKRFSGVLDTFVDIESVVERITNNIQSSIIVERQLQKEGTTDQSLCEQASKLTSQNKTDLKTLYVYTKIFLDRYSVFLIWIFAWRGIKNSSITEFYKSLKKYDGLDITILKFKECCFGKIEAIDDYITEYRDKEVVHNGDYHKQKTKWFMNGMNGEIKYIGGNRSSLTPQEILFLVVEYVDCSSQFCLEFLNTEISPEKKDLEKGLISH